MQTTYFWKKEHIEEVASRILWNIQVMRNRKVRKYEGIRFLGAKQIFYELWPQELWEKTHNYEKKIQNFWRTRSFCVFWCCSCLSCTFHSIQYRSSWTCWFPRLLRMLLVTLITFQYFVASLCSVMVLPLALGMLWSHLLPIKRSIIISVACLPLSPMHFFV